MEEKKRGEGTHVIRCRGGQREEGRVTIKEPTQTKGRKYERDSRGRKRAKERGREYEDEN